MDFVQRKTDYAIRALLHLAGKDGKFPASAKEIAEKENISFDLTCKLLQRLQKCKFVKSTMGPKGGFSLSRKPSKINLLAIIETIQGPVSLNRCLIRINFCPKKKNCPVRKRLYKLQKEIERSLAGIKLDDLAKQVKKNEKEK